MVMSPMEFGPLGEGQQQYSSHSQTSLYPSRTADLEINAEKNKYMSLSRHRNTAQYYDKRREN
jgi:hypothetical protein